MGIVSSQFLGLGGINLRWELVVKVKDVFVAGRRNSFFPFKVRECNVTLKSGRGCFLTIREASLVYIY